jgi:hypothetical protein
MFFITWYYMERIEFSMYLVLGCYAYLFSVSKKQKVREKGARI